MRIIAKCYIPSSVTNIGVNAFKSCDNLSEVVCIEGLPKFEHNTFRYCPDTLQRIIFPNISSRLNAIMQYLDL